MHWRHSDFQIRHFIAGKARTPDEAYRLVNQELENREIALRMAQASKLRQNAALMRAHRVLTHGSQNDPEFFEAQAAVAEIEANAIQAEACVAQCWREIKTLTELLDEIRPTCRFVGTMPDAEAFQAAQEEEWRLELIHRARVMLASSGFIPWDHLETMTLHPSWEDSILPAINQARSALRLGNGPESALTKGAIDVHQAPALS